MGNDLNNFLKNYHVFYRESLWNAIIEFLETQIFGFLHSQANSHKESFIDSA